jgi:hypothetical protein
MILRFKTKRNTYGNRSYLAMNTKEKTYSEISPRMIEDGEEITKKAMDNIKSALISDGYILTEAF